MRKVLLVSLMVLLVAGFAYAQNDDGYFRGRIGWVDAGDLDSDIGYGVDYVKGHHMFGFDYSSHEETIYEDIENGIENSIYPAQDGAYRVELDVDLMSFSYTWVQRMMDDEGMPEDAYYGAGVAYYDADVDETVYGTRVLASQVVDRASESDNTIGFHVVGGMEFGKADEDGRKPWFGEVRYVFGTEFDDFEDADVDGLRVFLGYSF